MNAFALASQDFSGSGSVVGPMAFSARKNAQGDENSGDSFDAALVQSEKETPTTTSPPPGAASSSVDRTASAISAFADAAASKSSVGEDGLWRDPPVVSGANFATTHAAAAAKSSAQAAVHAKLPAFDRFAKSLSAAVASSTPSAADDDAPIEKAPSPSKKTPSANEGAAGTGAEPTTPTSAADPLAARYLDAFSLSSSSSSLQSKAIGSREDGSDASTSAGEAAEADSVARIGAALASVSRRAALSGVTNKSAENSEISLATPDPSSISFVHVVAQQTWLQPVSAVFSPGLNRLATVDRAAREAPRAAWDSIAAARAPDTKDDVADSVPAADGDAALSSSIGFSFSGEGVLADEDSDSAMPSAKIPAAPPENASPPLAAAPRRDLEITLAPKDLGGLEVRMKSAGGRLEIAFVADKGETARMISDKSATLESQLHGAGLGLDGIEINAAAKMESGVVATLPASAGTSTNGGAADTRGNSENAPQGQGASGRSRQDHGYETGEKTSEPRASSGDRGLYL